MNDAARLTGMVGSLLPQLPEARADALALLSGASREPVMVRGVPSFAPRFADESYSGFNTEQIEAMVALQNGNFYWEGRNALIAWAVRAYFPGARRVLDVGCGTGYVTEAIANALPKAYIYGSDVFTDCIQHAQRRMAGRAFLMHLDAEDLPFTHCFDLVTSFDVLEHIAHDEAALAQLARSLRPGGGMLHIVPQHPWLWCPADTAAGHERRYRVGEIRHKIEALGLRVIADTSLMSFLLPAMAASRWYSRLRNSYNFDQEYAISPWLNRFMGHVLGLEVATIKAGARWPLGGSRMIAAVMDR